MAVAKQDVAAWIGALQAVYAAQKSMLTDLDSAIGDADHGTNLDRGFTAAKAELAAKAPEDIRGVLDLAARVLIRTVGGASGPLYGTFLLRAAAATAGKAALEAADVVALFEAGVAGVRERGKAEPGDKTMLDALIPAVAAMRESAAAGADLATAMRAGAEAAREGMLATIPMQARKGRASYLGPRSVGHQDPGATSSWLLLDTAAGLWR